MAPIFTGNKFGFGRGAAAAAPTPFSATGGNQNGITPGNGYTYHTFTSPGTLICAGDENKLCELFLVGAGGRGMDSAGGGGGGVVLDPTFNLKGGSTYTVTVGSAPSDWGPGGRNTTFVTGDAHIKALGGGQAKDSPGSCTTNPTGEPGGGWAGGSGSGTLHNGNIPGQWPQTLGTCAPGQQPTQPQPGGSPNIAGYGNPGGTTSGPGRMAGSGGGGAGGAGGNNPDPGTAGGAVGGAGKQFPNFPGPVIGVPALGPLSGYYGGGGGGNDNYPDPQPARAGGSGGGGDGCYGGDCTTTGGVTNSGGGGGAGPGYGGNGSYGGPGILVVRYIAG